MQKELLPAYLHIYHCLAHYRGHMLRLLDHFDGNADRLLAAPRSSLQALGPKPKISAKLAQSKPHQVDSDLAWVQQPGNHIVCHGDSAYPDLLREIADPPPLLYARGNIELLQSPQIAIVGSRLCTPGGAQTALEFGAQLAACGFTISSGLALGIDSQAHKGALQAGGATIAVCGTGVDRIYPAQNHKLAVEIAERGLIISEFPLGSAASKQNFPQRNRIISGLCLATLVVEAAERSGSLITARLAAEQGREVFAIPGSIHNPQARGCHRLIRDGAKLVEKIADISEDLPSLLGYLFEHSPATKSAPTLDAGLRDLLDTIGYDPVNTDTLAGRSGLTIDKLSSMLLQLELNDLIRSAPGGCYVRI